MLHQHPKYGDSVVLKVKKIIIIISTILLIDKYLPVLVQFLTFDYNKLDCQNQSLIVYFILEEFNCALHAVIEHIRSI